MAFLRPFETEADALSAAVAWRAKVNVARAAIPPLMMLRRTDVSFLRAGSGCTTFVILFFREDRMSSVVAAADLFSQQLPRVIAIDDIARCPHNVGAIAERYVDSDICLHERAVAVGATGAVTRMAPLGASTATHHAPHRPAHDKLRLTVACRSAYLGDTRWRFEQCWAGYVKLVNPRKTVDCIASKPAQTTAYTPPSTSEVGQRFPRHLSGPSANRASRRSQ